MLENTQGICNGFYSACMCVCLCACMHVCVQPCLQGEVEADALAAGLARLSGPNLQRRTRERRERGRKQIGVSLITFM